MATTPKGESVPPDWANFAPASTQLELHRWLGCFMGMRMQSDFSGARQCLERTLRHLQGSDETSKRSRQALGLLIEAMVTAERTQRTFAASILPFPGSHRRPDRGH